MNIYALTQKGIHKEENEDRVIIGKTILTNGIFQCVNYMGVLAIADGVGGNNAGAQASHFVANRIGELNEYSKESFEVINRDLIIKSNNSEHLNKMATTLSGIYYDGISAIYFHIGNTRIYALQCGGYLKQITEDDTTINYLIITGKLLPEDEDSFVDKNEIIACFGAGNENSFNIKIANILEIQTFLITSDGVHEYVSIDELEEIIQSDEDYSDVCKKIAEKAVLNGSHDDISVLIAYIENNEEEQ